MNTELPTIMTLADLKVFNQWVCHGANRGDKIPYTPKTHQPAKANDPATWGTYEQARRAWKKYSDKYTGIGFELVADQHLIVIDLDKCVTDGTISEQAQAILKRIDSYAEYSPSGTGIHIWARATLPGNLGSDPAGVSRIEMYSHDRYMTTTGKQVKGTPATINERYEEVQALYDEITKERAARKQKQRKVVPSPSLNGGTPYGLASLEDQCADLASSANGSRNTQLNRAAFCMGQLIAGNELERLTVEQRLSAVAFRIGLDEREIEKTLRSGLEAGMREPRSAPLRSAPLKEFSQNGTGKAHSEGPQEISRPMAISSESDLCDFSADDAGNGDAMHALFGQDFLWCHEMGWLYYDGRCWRMDASDAYARQSATETLRRRQHAAVDQKRDDILKCAKGDDKRVNGCLSRFKTLVGISINEFDKDPNLLNCMNGVLDLRTGIVEPHNKTQRFTYCLQVPYGYAEPIEWLTYLHDVLGDDEEKISYLQRCVGYSFTGHTREEVLFYLFGPTRSGKGTFAETLMALLPPPLSKMPDFNTFTASRDTDASNFDLAPLKPARLIFASESNRSQSLNPAKVKQLTGGDTVTCCYKHKDFFSYRPQFQVWMLSNHPVNGDPEDDALWGRVRVIEFPNSFLGKEDKELKERLKSPEVQQAVLFWAVQGAMEWYKDGLITPKTVTDTTKQHREELDYVQQWLEECCDGEGWTPHTEVMASYLSWCEQNNVQYPKGPKALSQSLKAKGYEVGKLEKVNGKVVRGVGGLHLSHNS